MPKAGYVQSPEHRRKISATQRTKRSQFIALEEHQKIVAELHREIQALKARVQEPRRSPTPTTPDLWMPGRRRK